MAGEEIQKVPLRHQRDETAARRQMGEVGKLHAGIAEDAGEVTRLLVRQLEKFVEQPELVHHLERRRVDGVAAEIAQEIAMLLQHHHVDTGAGEQIAEHHAGRSAAGDRAGGLDRLRLGHAPA